MSACPRDNPAPPGAYEVGCRRPDPTLADDPRAGAPC
jgi:hypothetical protein